MSTINIVKFFFFKGMKPAEGERLRQEIAVAYRIATRNGCKYPAEILIRKGAHPYTSISGKIVKDSRGNHWTIAYKDADVVQKGSHVVCHGHTPPPQDFNLTEVDCDEEKLDSTRKKNGRPAWPDASALVEGPELNMSHLEERP